MGEPVTEASDDLSLLPTEHLISQASLTYNRLLGFSLNQQRVAGWSPVWSARILIGRPAAIRSRLSPAPARPLLRLAKAACSFAKVGHPRQDRPKGHDTVQQKPWPGISGPPLPRFQRVSILWTNSCESSFVVWPGYSGTSLSHLVRNQQDQPFCGALSTIADQRGVGLLALRCQVAFTRPAGTFSRSSLKQCLIKGQVVPFRDIEGPGNHTGPWKLLSLQQSAYMRLQVLVSPDGESLSSRSCPRPGELLLLPHINAQPLEGYSHPPAVACCGPCSHSYPESYLALALAG